MINFGKKIVKHRKLVIIICLLLMIPAVIGYAFTHVNYDLLNYLPGDLETMKGQDILVDEFGMGAFTMVIVEDMPDKDVAALKAKIEQVDCVKDVLWYDSVADLSLPVDLLPDELKDAFYKDNATMMIALLEDTTSADRSMEAIKEIRKLCNEQCFASGMTGLIEDVKELSDKETPIYVAIAVVLSLIVLALTMESFITPVLFLLSIGLSILYNLGSNIIFGEISYITKALTAVLQLGVTMDYSIFLLNSYEANKERFNNDKERAMAHAISNTFKSVVSSSITTVAGFIALCFMSFTLGMDIGLVMAKGVILGVICCVTFLPSLILCCDGLIEKTKHKSLIPNMDRVSEFITKHSIVFFVLFVALYIPAVYCNNHTGVYYNLDKSIPADLPSSVANEKLAEEFEMNSVYMVVLDNDMTAKDKIAMIDEMEQVDGIKNVIGINSIVGPGIPAEMIPGSVASMLKSDEHELMFVCSDYKAATEEVNTQIATLSDVVKKYCPSGMLVGEAPLTKDLQEVTDIDFKNVSVASIAAIFAIILLVFKSISLPIILVLVIEFAININMGIPFLTGTTLPFVASVVIGTIQLGSTVDYAILMTSRYEKERNNGKSKKEAVSIAHKTSMKSILVSGISFFAATFGVAMYSDIDMISSLCTLLARGAAISTVVVILVLPSMFMIFDKVICKTSIGFGPVKNTLGSKKVKIG
ncbi:MMPL family transporter [Falcatimonas sp. MSJ-15]|uniref:efflux RND transporter permease subunit n=1 Tax=Falcatimonas sp. MSJ-15 TaxID=2841515 RepID=UPI001C10CA78|nr:efflux RND transporter permease subunit [Falcatimonas sp. MSJ-15]MBU5470390.1 MMPL family transporter [Falcatimonas sp. MSJ-15]